MMRVNAKKVMFRWSNLFLFKVIILFTIWVKFVNVKTVPSTKNCCGPGCRVKTTLNEYYGQRYFNWQKGPGIQFARKKNWDMFFGTSPNMTVADLGAGGAFTLATLNVKRKIAVEINPIARQFIKENTPEIVIHKYPEDVPRRSIDLLISTHALEHMECPVTELREIRKALKPGGRAIIAVPSEGTQFASKESKNDIHQHLYTWNRQLLYNTVAAAGFEVERIEPPIQEHLNKLKNLKEDELYKTHRAVLELWALGINTEN